MAERWDQEVSAHILTALGFKRTYAPQPTSGRTFLGACVDEALEQREHPWDTARLHREWVVQKLNELAGIKTSAATSATAAIPPDKPFAGVKSTKENVAKALRAICQPDGVPDVGFGWKKAEPELRAVGMVTKCSTFNCAVRLNKERRRLRIVSA
jgi:hypothetical protein